MSIYNVLIKFLGVDNCSPQMKKVAASVENLQNKIHNASANIQTVSSSILRFTGVLAGIGIYALKNADNFEVLENQLRATTGSLDIARSVMRDLTQMSLTEPFSIEDLATASKKLLAIGVSAKDLSKEMKMIGELAAGSGQSMEFIAGQYLTMKNRGAAVGRMMKALNAAGIPLKETLKEMAKEHGISSAAFEKAYLKTKFGFNLIHEAMARISGGRFAGSMDRMSKTVEGSMIILHTAARVYAKDLGDALANVFGIKEGLGEMVKRIAQFEKPFRIFLETHGALIKIVVLSLAFLAVLALIAKVATVISILISPIGLIVVGIGLLAAGAYWVYKHFAEVKKIIVDVWNWIKNIGSEMANWTKNLFGSALEVNKNIAVTSQSTQKGFLDVFMHDRNGAVKNVSGGGDYKFGFDLGRSTAGAT